MNNLTTKTVREIALETPLTTKVFENHKIDFCCGGNRLLLEACRTAGANPENVLRELSVYLESPAETELDWVKTASLTRLIEYIVEKHHTYTRDELKSLSPLMVKVTGKHGEHHVELFALEALFSKLCGDLAPHLLKEERVLFPYILELEKLKDKSGEIPGSCFGTVQNPVGAMMMEHDTAGEILRTMREVSRDYEVPEGACPSYTALLTRLEALEKDLHQHIHLENNILFPKAVELENEMFGVEE